MTASRRRLKGDARVLFAVFHHFVDAAHRTMSVCVRELEVMCEHGRDRTGRLEGMARGSVDAILKIRERNEFFLVLVKLS